LCLGMSMVASLTLLLVCLLRIFFFSTSLPSVQKTAGE
jgi:hypothetical protein